MAAGTGRFALGYAYGAAYAATALAVAAYLPFSTGNLSALLPPHAHSAIEPAVLALPALIGVVLQLAGRRLWTWPWVYLLSLYLVHTASGIDGADRLYLYSSQLAALLTVALAETLGLSLGRWLNRPSAIGYFCVVGVMLIVHANGPADSLLPLWIRQVTFNAAGSLFLVQGAIQLVLWRVRTAREARGEPEQTAADAGAEESTPDESA